MFFFIFAVALYLLVKWSMLTYDYFKKQNFPYRASVVPLFGTNLNMLTRKKAHHEILTEWYYQFPDEKASGLFELRRPTILIRDPKLVKQLAIKDFEYFTDRRSILPENSEQMINKTLVGMKGQKWKDMRSTLSPAFTGSKMRQMFEFVNVVGEQTSQALLDDIRAGGENSFEFKSLAMKFTVDVIASCAFGIENDSFKNPANDFYRIASKVTNFASLKVGLKVAGFGLFPSVMKFFNVSLLDPDSCDFFEKAITETMKTREREGIVRHDMINLLLQAKKGQLTHSEASEEKITDGFATVEESQFGKSDVKRVWNDVELAAQCFAFFFAGFDSVSRLSSFLVHELVINPEVQQMLYEEIQDMHTRLAGNEISYEQMQSMKYLDQVICEGLRKWPVAPAIDRICVKPYELKSGHRTLRVDKDVSLMIPVWNFHYDPKYFPNPEKFDPDRFSEENRDKIDPDTYLPFGVGPRSCIASRFALMELKTIFYHMLLNFSFEANDKTQIPLKLAKIAFGIRSERGIWVSLKQRKV